MSYILLAFFGAFLWGLADITTKTLLAQGISPVLIAFVNSVVSVFILFLMIDFSSSLTSKSLVLLFVNGILVLAGLLLFYKAVQIGKVSVASAVMSSKILWTTIFALFFLREGLSIRELAGIGFILLGLLLLQRS